ncbi:IS21 family transposase [Elizabethkingia anophelis]|nr:IS21 family transposase [Elizabethkingia anophelis]
MSKLKQVLQLHLLGYSNRRISRDLELDKGTVNRYVNKIRNHHYDPESLLELEEPVLEGKFHAGHPAYKQERFEDFKERIPYFEKELSRRHVKRITLWEEYIESNPDGYRYSQFCYHLSQLKRARGASSPIEYVAAEKLYVDFAGDTMEYIDRESGEVLKAQIFVACFPYSDYTFIMAVPSQRSDDFLYALSCSLKYFGGSPKILVPDNLKSAVIKADRYEPELNLLMEDFANHYGIVVIPARPKRPKDKASVENQVKIIYTRVYAKLRNEKFFTLEELNKALLVKTKEHNQTRMQQKPYSREEKFLADEKPQLKVLAEKDFEVKYYTSLTVSHNNCIYLGRDKHYYSVPYAYIGKKVAVIYTRTLVKIYCENECIATHLRTVGYGYTVIKDHLSSSHQYYQNRSPEYYIRQAEKRSACLPDLIRLNFDTGTHPELLYKRCDGLLSLQRKTDPVVFEKACAYAITHHLLSYKALENIIRNKAFLLNQEQKPLKKNPTTHENIRGKEYYQNINQNKQLTLWNNSETN